MGVLLIVIGIGYIIFKLIQEAAEPTQTKGFDFEQYNKDTLGKGYTPKQLSKMAESGRWNTKDLTNKK